MKHTDWPLYFFGVAALLSLLVSLPATSAAMQLTHDTGWWWAAVGVFELGAVGLELMTLAVPQWRGRLLVGTVLLLALTTGANYAAGADHLAVADLAPGSTYAAVRGAGFGWALALGLSALFPALLFAFLMGFVERWKMLSVWQAADVRLALREQEIAQQLTDLASRESDLVRRQEEAARALTPIVMPELSDVLPVPRSRAEDFPELADLVREITGQPQPVRPEHAGYVYVVSNNDGAHKIGMAVDVEKRVEAIRPITPHGITLVHAIKTDHRRLLERRLHECFADRRLRGEWFALTESDLDAITALGEELSRDELDDTIDLLSAIVNMPVSLDVAVNDGEPEIVRLKEVDKLSFAAIGERLGISRQAAWQKYRDAKRVS